MAGKKLVAVAGASVPSLRFLYVAPKALRGVVEHKQTFRLGNCCHRVVIRRQAEQIDRNDGLGREPLLLRHRNGALQAPAIDVESRLVDIDKDRRRAKQSDDFRRGAKGESGTEHRIAAADALGHQHQQERIGAAGAADGVARAAECGEIPLEGLHLGAHDELAMCEHPRNGVINGATEAAALGGHVDEGNRGGIKAGVLVHQIHNFKKRGWRVSRQRGGEPCVAWP